MSLPLTFVELCAGGGGLSLGLERGGWRCVAHAEIEDFPRRVLSHHWPSVPLLGDITTIDGAQLTRDVGPFTLLSGGTPCQDLSIAGKRAGLDGARSALFFHHMRLWNETAAPLCLWENVEGAYSSNDGADFGAILSAFVGAAVAVPRLGWTAERRCGVVSGPTGVAAWRLLDAQYFGVPQRRARVFVLGSRTSRIDPAEILLEPEGVRWDSPPLSGSRQDAPADSGSGAASGGRAREPLLAFDSKQSAADVSDTVSPPLRAMQHDKGKANGGSHVAVAIDLAQVTSKINRAQPQPQPQSPTLNGKGQVVTFNETGHKKWTEEDVAGSLNAHEAREAREARTIIGTLNARHAGGFQSAQSAQSAHLVPVPFAFKPSHFTRDKDAGPTPILPPLTADADKGDQESVLFAGAVRRLTPLECERVMGWNDNHTNVPDAKGKPPSDSARYRICGNGVASPVTHWLGLRLRTAMERAE